MEAASSIGQIRALCNMFGHGLNNCLCTSVPVSYTHLDYIQESAPERLTVKQALYKELAPLAKMDAVIASSTSALPARCV